MENGAAIVVAYHSGSYVDDCLAVLSGRPGWEVVLIENASEEGGPLYAGRADDQVKVVRNAENRGFAGAVNQGVRLTTAPVLVALNADAIAVGDSLNQLAGALAEPGVGVAGGLLLGGDGRPQKGFVVRRFPTLASGLCEVLLLNRVWPSNPWNARYRCLDFDYSSAQEIEQPAGAALAFRREAWESVGGFDERFYPAWYEDVDFCLRLRQQGWKIAFCPNAVFRHAGGHSVMRLAFGKRQLYWYGNLLRYFRKHHGRGAVGVMRAGIVAGMILRSLATLAAGAPAGVARREALSSYLQIIRRYGVGSAV